MQRGEIWALLVQSPPFPPPGSLDDRILGAAPGMAFSLSRVWSDQDSTSLSRTTSREPTFLLLPRPLVATLPNDKFGILKFSLFSVNFFHE